MTYVEPLPIAPRMVFGAQVEMEVSLPLYAHVAPRRGWIMSLKEKRCIRYFVPGEETKPATLSALARPCPYSVSWLSSAPTLNVQLCMWIVSLSSKFVVLTSEWIA